jgi:formylglycine-generating enzyme required for sulfatase activity
VKDFEPYCLETHAPMPEVDFAQGPEHPVVNVTWNDAMHFCEWLTKRELWLGLIIPQFQYRLPRDDEWSAAVGMPFESAASPRARSGVVEGFPWGTDFPPPPGVGNYHPRLSVDEFPETSPVGSFPPNKFGLYDMGGNVWEWCMDEYDKGSSSRVLRGASCFNDDQELLLSSSRDKAPAEKCRNNVGIRLVVASQSARDPWYKA